MARKPRKLNTEEQDLWRKVADKATPMHPTRTASETSEQALIRPKKAKPVEIQSRYEPKAFRLGERAGGTPGQHDLAPSIQDQVAAQHIAMDHKRYKKMKSGKLSPEAKIDLHGMTLAQAHPALIRFIIGSVGEGRRLVLVVTGKGKTKPDSGPIPERHGVLRHQVPHWLNSMPLKPHILTISNAHVKHGGGGAYYVYLRRDR